MVDIVGQSVGDEVHADARTCHQKENQHEAEILLVIGGELDGAPGLGPLL